MKQVKNNLILSGFTLLTGGICMAMRLWLFSMADGEGLLPSGHIAEILMFVLLACQLAVLLIAGRGLQGISYRRLFPRSLVAAAGCLVGGVGIGIMAVTQYIPGELIELLILLSGLIAAGCLLVLCLCRLSGRRSNGLLHCGVALFLLMRLIDNCRDWGMEPQLQVFLFPALSTVFSLLAAYQHGATDVSAGNGRALVFFNQAALFCTVASLGRENTLLYACIAFWLLTNLCRLQPATGDDAGKEVQ